MNFNGYLIQDLLDTDYNLKSFKNIRVFVQTYIAVMTCLLLPTTQMSLV